jgi:hypothetical protein
LAFITPEQNMLENKADDCKVELPTRKDGKDGDYSWAINRSNEYLQGIFDTVCNCYYPLDNQRKDREDCSNWSSDQRENINYKLQQYYQETYGVQIVLAILRDGRWFLLGDHKTPLDFNKKAMVDNNVRQIASNLYGYDKNKSIFVLTNPYLTGHFNVLMYNEKPYELKPKS